MDRRNFFTVMAAWAMAFVFNPIKFARAPHNGTMLDEWPIEHQPGVTQTSGSRHGPMGVIAQGTVEAVGVFGVGGRLLHVSKFSNPIHVRDGDTLEIKYTINVEGTYKQWIKGPSYKRGGQSRDLTA